MCGGGKRAGSYPVLHVPGYEASDHVNVAILNPICAVVLNDTIRNGSVALLKSIASVATNHTLVDQAIAILKPVGPVIQNLAILDQPIRLNDSMRAVVTDHTAADHGSGAVAFDAGCAAGEPQPIENRVYLILTP